MSLKIGVLASGGGSNFQSILDAVADKRLDAEIAVVMSDNPDAFALERGATAGVPTCVVELDKTKTREAHDEKVVAALKEHGVDTVVLAGYMLMITPVLLGAFPMRVINIHPALLPSFSGLHVQQAAIDYGAKFSGCTVHFVDEGMDTGPVIIQAVVPIRDDDTASTLGARILREEHRIFPQALQYLAEGRLRVEGRRVLLDPQSPASGALHNPVVSS
jgi:phosphoribosylglycinamide formyltransferase-1